MKSAICYWIALVIIGFLFSCGGNKQKTEVVVDVQTPENTLDWQGTYEGILPGADCPGIYVLIAIDSSSYQSAFKYIERPGIYISMGDIRWNAAGDSISLLGDHATYEVHDGMLCSGMFQLSKIANDIKLPELLLTQTLKEDKSGKNAVLEQYTVGNKQFANFYFDKKVYKMKRAITNNMIIEYTDGKARLLPQGTDSVSSWVAKPRFIDGKDTLNFTILSPVNEIYVAQGSDQVTRSFDVLYLNGEEGSEVKLLNPEYKYCFTLPQVEASAKSAEYYNNGVMWTSGSQKATLTLGDKAYQFVQESSQ